MQFDLGLDEIAQHIGVRVTEPVAEVRVADQPLLDCQRDRAGFSGIGTAEYSSRSHSSTRRPRRAVAARHAPGLARHEADRPATQDTLLVEPEHVLGEWHAAGEPRLGDDPPRLHVEPLAHADGRELRAVVRPEHDRVEQIVVGVLNAGRDDDVAGAVGVDGRDDASEP